jgi:hypothetical protein
MQRQLVLKFGCGHYDVLSSPEDAIDALRKVAIVSSEACVGDEEDEVDVNEEADMEVDDEAAVVVGDTMHMLTRDEKSRLRRRKGYDDTKSTAENSFSYVELQAIPMKTIVLPRKASEGTSLGENIPIPKVRKPRRKKSKPQSDSNGIQNDQSTSRGEERTAEVNPHTACFDVKSIIDWFDISKLFVDGDIALELIGNITNYKTFLR